MSSRSWCVWFLPVGSCFNGTLLFQDSRSLVARRKDIDQTIFMGISETPYPETAPEHLTLFRVIIPVPSELTTLIFRPLTIRYRSARNPFWELVKGVF